MNEELKKETNEFIALLQELTPEEKAKAEGIVIGMQLQKNVTAPQKPQDNK